MRYISCFNNIKMTCENKRNSCKLNTKNTCSASATLWVIYTAYLIKIHYSELINYITLFLFFSSAVFAAFDRFFSASTAQQFNAYHFTAN